MFATRWGAVSRTISAASASTRDAEAARSAQALFARAFTHGRHIFVGANRYATHNTDGQRLLAHELAHVVRLRRPQLRRHPFPARRWRPVVRYRHAIAVRGIPLELGRRTQLHNSKIREILDRHYRALDDEIARRGLRPGTQEYNDLVRSYMDSAVAQVDWSLGIFFSEQRAGLPLMYTPP